MAPEEMTATEVAALLDLKPHPEGGFYAETFRDGSVTLTTSQLPPQYHDESVRSRSLTEEHARDSFENLLFSVCRFRELTGRYPQNITIPLRLHWKEYKKRPALID